MGQIVFVTLFLGLTMGRAPVEMLVTGDVVKVELLLDREVVATLHGPPWRAPVDLGTTLAPRRLEARGYDANGRLITTIEQKVNAPVLVRDLQLVLERNGAEASARILWSSLDSTKPDKIVARVDHRPVRVRDDMTIPLPPLAGDTVHLLDVQVYSDSGQSEAQLVFGGAFEDTASTALTAVPVRIKGRSVKRDGVTATVRDTPVRVMALDDLPAEVIIIREPLTLEFSHLARRTVVYDRVIQPGSVRETMVPRIRPDPALAPQDQVRFLWPVARPSRAGNATLFYPSQTFDTNQTGIGLLLGRVSFSRPTTELRFADAVALAGWRAAQSQRPRAVVLVLGRHLDDRSRITPEHARQYLERIGVPLYVWTAGRDVPEAAKAWGELVDVRTQERLANAVRQLRRDLDSQRILWVEGDYLAAEVRVAHENVTALVR